MKNINKYLLAVALLGVGISSSQAAPLRVTVLMAEELGAFQEFAQAYTSAVQRQSSPPAVAQATTLPADTDLIIAVGIKSAQIASNSKFPVLSVLVSKASFENLLGKLPVSRAKDGFSAILLDQPPKRQVAMVVAALPEAKNIGLLSSAHTPDAENLRKSLEAKGLKLNEQQLTSSESLYRDLGLVLEESDVLLAIPDAEVYNALTMRNILLATYRRRVPVVGFSASYVKAGALCAVFTTPSQIAKQAADMTKHFIEETHSKLPAAQYPAEFDIAVNQQVARSLGVQIREDAVLIKEIKAAASSSEEAE